MKAEVADTSDSALNQFRSFDRKWSAGQPVTIQDIFFSRVAEVNDHFAFPVPIGIQYVEIQVFAPFTFFKFFQN